MAKIRFQQQSEHSECGLACVAMLIDYFAGNIKLTKLRDDYGVPTGGYNFFQMKQILEDYNLESKAIKADSQDLTLLPTPFVVFWNKNHFIIVENIKRDSVKIIDPALGKQKIEYNDFSKSYSGFALYVTTPRVRKQSFSLKNINNDLFSCLKNVKKELLGVALLSFVMQIFSILLPTLMQRIIDNKINISINGIWNIFLFFLVLVILYFLTNMGRNRLITKLQTVFDKNLLGLTIRYLLGLPYSYFSNRSKGEIIYRINSNSYIRQILVDNVIGSIVDLLFFFVYLIALFYFNYYLAIVSLVLAFIIILFSVINARINQIMTQKELIASTKTQGVTSELVNNIFTVKATNTQQKFFKKWNDNFNEQIDIEIKKSKYSSIFLNIPQTIQAFYSLIIIFIGYILIINNKTTIGSVVAFNSVGVTFLTPLMSIINAYSQLLVVKVYIERLLDILETPSEKSMFGNNKVENIQGQIELKNVSFKYSKFSDDILSDISLTIRPNEKVAIVGPSGSGKSTLLHVISGLNKITSGTIKYDNQDINNLNIQELRKHLGIVLQNHNVFNGTIKENITMERGYSDDDVFRTISLTGLNDFIAELPIGLNTHISEDGNNLSGGQSQKLSLARTIIANPKVLLLDEPTSSLDNISEIKIMNNLFNMEATVVVVAHRLSTIGNFDKIIVLNHGVIVGQGTHEQLLSSNELYQKLYRKEEYGK